MAAEEEISPQNLRRLFDWSLHTSNQALQLRCATVATLLEKTLITAPRRQGKWPQEELEYALYLKHCFHFLAPQGASLRDFMATRLHCEPMRVTKKMSQSGGLGKLQSHGLEDLNGCILGGEMQLRISFLLKVSSLPEFATRAPAPPHRQVPCSCCADAAQGLLLLKHVT